MSANVKISATIPYYNVELDLLIKCVKSVLTQDFNNFEVIIVDDGSAEEYSLQLDKIRQIDERIRVIRQKNSGVSVARNIGVKASKGEYITFIDADDNVVPYFFFRRV